MKSTYLFEKINKNEIVKIAESLAAVTHTHTLSFSK